MPPNIPMLPPAQLAKLQGFQDSPPPPKQKRRKGGGIVLAIVAAMHAEGVRRTTPWKVYKRVEALGETGKWPKVHTPDGWIKTFGDLLGDHYLGLKPMQEVANEGTEREIPEDLGTYVTTANLDVDC